MEKMELEQRRAADGQPKGEEAAARAAATTPAQQMPPTELYVLLGQAKERICEASRQHAENFQQYKEMERHAVLPHGHGSLGVTIVNGVAATAMADEQLGAVIYETLRDGYPNRLHDALLDLVEKLFADAKGGSRKG